VAAASNKRSAFMAKLHNEEEEESGAFRRNNKRSGVNLKDYEDEMKVFTMGDSDDEDGTTGAKKRELKGADKVRSSSKKMKSEGAKVNRLVRDY
jgi:hypothetical protein